MTEQYALNDDELLALVAERRSDSAFMARLRERIKQDKPTLDRLTSDPNDPRLTRGVDEAPVPMAEAYLVLSDDERAKGFVRPYRNAYRHLTCGTVTTMGRALSETYARQPDFYGATFCVACSMHRPVGEHGEFVWIEADGSVGPKVGT